jgi:hypothetical protein
MNPIKGLFFGVAFIVFLNSYILLLNERSDSADLIGCCNELDRASAVTCYRDALWLTMVTFFTVGYGDFYPNTNLGRYVMIVTTMSGQLYSAFVIGLVHS